MKRICLSLLLLLTSLSLLPAQETQTLLGDEWGYTSGHGGFAVRLTPLGDAVVPVIGGFGAGVINDRWLIGGGGYNLRGTLPQGEVSLGYGGILLGTIVAPHRRAHLHSSVLLGGGGYELAGAEGQAVMVVEPLVELELNVTRFFRLGLGGGYRLLTGNAPDDGPQPQDLSGLFGGISFRFGWFGE